MRTAFFCAAFLALSGLVGNPAWTRESTADRDADSAAECSKDQLETGSRIRQAECRKLAARKRAAERAGMDQVADTLKKDSASGSTRTRAQTN